MQPPNLTFRRRVSMLATSSHLAARRASHHAVSRLALANSTRSRCRQFSSSAPTCEWKEARFQGATVTLSADALDCIERFEREFEALVADIRANDRQGVFMKVRMSQSAAIAVAARHGFRFHHAVGDEAMLLNWLPSTPSPVPDFATHVVGVGGMALNESYEVLAVKERRAPASTAQGAWKLPGGLLELGEEIADGVAREVREDVCHVSCVNVHPAAASHRQLLAV